ncbi:hypothetical protein QBC37DRAFT_402768 [Rhypophila decipiens]|uniref:Uncharacterized protein n=1 Tax=Rhypophila decipiens TaxID=261697 RepID=A0AAN7B5J1_9PEZI|nr:hypothetical protein QBC37DRAFT_402768 [Rhypophila decipiens]
MRTTRPSRRVLPTAQMVTPCTQTSLQMPSGLAFVVISTRMGSYHDAQPIDVLEDWVKANLGSIMKTPHARTVKKKGLWIVTKTFTSKKRAVAVMQSSGQSVALGVDASIPNIVKVGPSMKWWETMVDKPGWKAQVDDDGVVLFMSGLYWKPWPIVKSLHVKREKERQTLLGVADGIDAVVKGGQPGEEDEEYYTFKPNMVGRVEGNVAGDVPKINYFDEMESSDDDD